MASPQPPSHEHEIRRLCDARDFDGAASAALRGYGPEVLEFLVALHHRSEADASEVKREAARLRKRFQLVKDKLYEMARRDGLIDPGRAGRRR